MRPVLVGFALCVICLAKSTPDIEVVVPPSAAHPQSWLRPQIRDNPNPDYRDKPAASFGEFVAPEVISRIVVDQYAGPPDDVRRYLTAMAGAPARYFGPSLVLCETLAWTSTSTVTFESGRRGRLAVATVYKGSYIPRSPGGSACVGSDKVPVDSLYVSYVDPDGYSWYFVVPLQKKQLSLE
jgi:hypothetical protein